MAFGSLRFGRTAVHLLHLHALEEEADIPVLERCIEFVRKAGATRLVTTDYWTRRDLYLRYGFCSIRKIGRFMRFERESNMNTDGLLDKLEQALKTEKGDLDRRVAIYNRIVALASAYLDMPHPATCPQLVPVDDVRGNDYNPNKVAPPEMQLLRLSLLKDGFTMPVVVAGDRKGYVVVDGFHRRQLAKTDAQIRKSLGGYLPVVRLDKSIEDRITSTVRHNMARGSHQVELTARLVTLLRRHNWTNERSARNSA